MRTKLSIIIAVRNGDLFLKQTLDCIPNSCDLIISDNLSTDSTLEIATKSNVARVVQPKEFLSMSQNWNFVTSHVNTEYFRLCGHDDLINPESLQAHVNMLENHPEAVAVFSRRDFLFTIGKKEICLPKKKFNNKIYQSPIDLIRQICVTGTNPRQKGLLSLNSKSPTRAFFLITRNSAASGVNFISKILFIIL